MTPCTLQALARILVFACFAAAAALAGDGV